MAAEQNRNLEDMQAPAPASADVINGQIQHGEYQNAYAACQKSELTDAECEDFSKNIDMASLPQNDQNKEALSPAEYEETQQENLDKNIDDFAIEHNPAARLVNDSQELLAENEEIVNELLAEVRKAKTQIGKARGSHQWSLNVIPIVSDVYGLLKQRRVKNHLRKIELLNNRLSNGANPLSENLQAENANTAKGQGKSLGGTAGMLVGAGLLGPLGMLPGAIYSLRGGFQSFETFEESGKRIEDLDKLESQLLTMQGETQEGLEVCTDAKTEYTEGANEYLGNKVA